MTARTTRNGIRIESKEIHEFASKLVETRIVGNKKIYPQIAVHGIPKDLRDDNIIQGQIMTDNPELKSLKSEQFKFVTQLSSDRSRDKTLVFRTDDPTLNMILAKGFLKVGLRALRVSENFDLHQCTRCLFLGKKKDKCGCCPNCFERHEGNCIKPKVSKCMKCGGNHLANSCSASKPSCIYCVNHPVVKKKNLSSDHRQLSVGCHVSGLQKSLWTALKLYSISQLMNMQILFM